MSCLTNKKCGFPAKWAILRTLPVIRLSIPRTLWPSDRKRSHRCEPINPAAPVIRIRTLHLTSRTDKTSTVYQKSPRLGCIINVNFTPRNRLVVRDDGTNQKNEAEADCPGHVA